MFDGPGTDHRQGFRACRVIVGTPQHLAITSDRVFDRVTAPFHSLATTGFTRLRTESRTDPVQSLRGRASPAGPSTRLLSLSHMFPLRPIPVLYRSPA